MGKRNSNRWNWAQKVKKAKSIPWLKAQANDRQSKVEEYRDNIAIIQRILNDHSKSLDEYEQLRKRQSENWEREPSAIAKMVLRSHSREWEAEQNAIRARMAEIKKTIPEKPWVMDPTTKEYERLLSIAQRHLRDAESDLSLINEKLSTLSMRAEREQLRKAKLAQVVGESRRAARSVKKMLPSDRVCPYCLHTLGPTPHADHIIPIAMGGLSVESNMIHICAKCNLKKKDKTLLEFCRETGLDFTEIADRLYKMNKRV